MRDGKEVLIRKVQQYKPLIVCFNGKGEHSYNERLLLFTFFCLYTRFKIHLMAE